ncbi:uncharacterized protein LOC131255639 isoform X1 [Magnolia sinica]|uniref:uncharacterized protein LOC131255639 isoform X1 n=1 Tax=Magnolia sinica TaxID=86752 RepID=UPI0026597ED9|nr:uncharacterized protein LOC131255639 isoform X1 [Magnolia sinica]
MGAIERERTIMEMKAEELLKEVRLQPFTPKAATAIEKAISAISEAIENIPQHYSTINEAAPGIARDLLSSSSDKDKTIGLTFKKPVSLEIVGSYAIGCITKPHSNVDILLRMPRECFHEKDYLNYRYHAKRCLYLCIIKRHLKSCPAIRTIKWSTFHNEARKPVLILYPDLELAEPFEVFIRLIPTAASLFSISKLNLGRNNIRALNQGSIPKPTPKYNSSILEDMFLEENAAFVKETFLEWRDLGDALVLLKVWARNRSSIYTHDCLNGFLMSVIISYLATESGGNRINRSMTPMAIFRITLDFIANSKLWDKGFSLHPLGHCTMSKEEKSQHLQSSGTIVCDFSGHFNLAFRMTRSALIELQDVAVCTLNCMDKCRDGGFEEVFMTKVDFPAKFDYCMRINLKGSHEFCESGFFLDDECWRIYEERVHSLLEQALNDRAKFIRVTWRSTPSEWNIEDGFAKFGDEPIFAGIIISSFEKSFRTVDVGPNAENKEEAAKFRKFWGEKAELRRFKDGTIAESTVWECEQWEKHLIIKRITEYILSRHFSLSNEDMVHVVDQLDFCLHHGFKDPISVSGGLLRAFEVLSKRLRHVDGVPLSVSSVQPLDPAFRYTSVFPPEPHPLANEKDVNRRSQFTTCIQPVEVMIQLEGSGNWPLDDVAIQKTKSAFLLRIGESLQNRWGMMCIASEDEVNVLMSGYAFQLRILHERSINCSRKQVDDYQKKEVDKELFLRGQHSSMINGLQGRYPTYGPVVRLAKRWFASHFFSPFLSEGAIELLVAYLFLKPFPFYTPCSRITGFLRFLRLLSSYDWTFSPLVVDINNDLTLEDEKEVNENFVASRKAYEEKGHNIDPAMFLATSYDKASEAWTKFSPNTSVLRRMVSYARSSADLLTKLILEGQMGPYRWECLFRTPLNNYDAVILLHKDKLPYPQRLLFLSEMNQGRRVIQGNASKDFHPYISLVNKQQSFEEIRNKLMVNFDPTSCFVEDLKRKFPDTFKVWYDTLGGDAIGLTWEKSGLKKRQREECEVAQDTIGILKEVGEVGKGFVKSVYYLKAPRIHS